MSYVTVRRYFDRYERLYRFTVDRWNPDTGRLESAVFAEWIDGDAAEELAEELADQWRRES